MFDITRFDVIITKEWGPRYTLRTSSSCAALSQGKRVSCLSARNSSSTISWVCDIHIRIWFYTDSNTQHDEDRFEDASPYARWRNWCGQDIITSCVATTHVRLLSPVWCTTFRAFFSVRKCDSMSRIKRFKSRGCTARMEREAVGRSSQ